MSLQTEYPFTLPKGFVDEQGTQLRRTTEAADAHDFAVARDHALR